MRRLLAVCAAGAAACALVAAVSAQPAARAHNVVLFLADAGGLPTLSAASIYGYGEPRRLFINTMPHVALSETSSASQWVTDSAAGMTAIVTGAKTHNGVLAESDASVRGQKDGPPLQTILEYAEEHGLSTGVVTNSSVLDATPAACYAHVNDRGNDPEILRQLLTPRFGDGVDVVIGNGRRAVVKAAEARGLDAKQALMASRLPWFDSFVDVSRDARRAVVLMDEDFDVDAATQTAIDVLSRNPKGYFLMVESDTHTETVRRGLDHVLLIDKALRHTVERAGSDTLVLFTADHSYDFRVRAGRKSDPLVPPSTPPDFGHGEESVTLPDIRRDDSHTGEDVVVAAQGPGSDGVHGFLVNTDLFRIMMDAFGWP